MLILFLKLKNTQKVVVCFHRVVARSGREFLITSNCSVFEKFLSSETNYLRKVNFPTLITLSCCIFCSQCSFYSMPLLLYVFKYCAVPTGESVVF